MNVNKIKVVLFCLLLSNSLLSQNNNIKDTVIRNLINKKEIDTIFNKNLEYYRNAIYIVPIFEFKSKSQCGFYRYGANSAHSGEYTFIIENGKILFLNSSNDENIEILLKYIDKYKFYISKNDIIKALKYLIIESKKRIKYQDEVLKDVF